jgi:hypothetical protein
MGILKLIASLIKAVPILGRFFLKIDEFRKERKAQNRYEEKLDFINDAVDKFTDSGVCDDEAEQCGRDGGTPSVSRCCKSGPRVDKGSTQKISKPRVSTRKKIKLAKKKTTKNKTKDGSKEKRSSPRKGRSKRVQQTKKNTEPPK